MDDPFISCPFNPQHRVPRSRIQGHIVKCQKNYPDFQACPYNATHRHHQDDMKAHILNCPAKNILHSGDIPPKFVAALTKPKPILQREYLPETDPNHEIWDN